MAEGRQNNRQSFYNKRNDHMRILAISGSPRKKNIYNMIKTVLETAGGFYEMEVLKEKNIMPCNDCRSCHNVHKCILRDDMAEIYDKLKKADIIVLGSPTYFHNVSGPMKNFMDRCLPFYFSRKLEGKKAILLASGNFEDQLELDKDGKCKWHKEEQESVKRCLKSMEYFCEILGIKIVGSVYALHDDWKGKEKELTRIGKKIV